MNQQQAKLVDMLSWFHNLCKDNNITYYAVGGTALGAIRHNGFIPWDDDIDVGIPRNDYDKFIKLANGCSGKYHVEYPGINNDFLYPYAKIYDTETTLIENQRYKIKRGIYIDVFPLDGLGNSKTESINNFKKIDRMINLLCAMRYPIDKRRRRIKNFSIVVARLIPKFVLTPQNLVKRIEGKCRAYDYSECEYVANCVGVWHEKEIMKREWFGTPVLHNFENIQIFLPKDSHSYLTGLYGDYMKLPPEEKCVSHHDYLELNLNKSYL